MPESDNMPTLCSAVDMTRLVHTLRVIFFLLLLPLQLASQTNNQRDLTRYVDPFIGTGGHGHTFPGATLPFGMVQLSPDTRLSGWDGCSGYHYSDHIIYGFSHTHLSGTGIPDYGDVLLMPTVGEVSFGAITATPQTGPDKGYASSFSHQNETASPGYYAVKLDDDDILVELTATQRVGLHRYSFPRTERANIILDLAHRDKVLDSYLRVVDSTHIEGFRRSESWAKDQIVYFVAEFSRPFLQSDIVIDQAPAGLSEARGTNIKASFRFSTLDGVPVLTKVALSTVSIEGARKNLAAEIDHWDFNRVKVDADRVWNTELRKVETNGGTAAQLKSFYTALYHTMIAPNLSMDVDGKYRGRDFKTHTARGFDNFTVFSLWDTFRAAHPLYTIIDQKRTVDFIKTFLAQYEQGGRLPVWELAANETDTMIGYHAVSVIADAAAKDVAGFDPADRERAFAAMKDSAELKHFGLDSYMRQGYIGMEDERESVSRTLEYAYDDWCIAEMARMLGHTADYERYIRRAQSYKNVFDPESGFMRPRKNGGWLAPFDPREVNSNFTEANSWQYTFFVPQDLSGLMQLMGGREQFARKLDTLFIADSKTTGREQADITGLIGQYAHGNEPSHHMAYLYDYANQPWKTQVRVRQIVDDFYKPEPDGLIGNEDCGQMSAWYVLSAAGFYPVTPGSPIYAIGSPLFPEMRFNLESGKAFVIKARSVSDRNVYIQSAALNGRSFNRSYLSHLEIIAGGELIFEMGPRPNLQWGGKEVPVSRITGQQIIPVPVIKAAGKTFKDFLQIGISSLSKGTEVHFTTDGSEPTIRAQRYTRPLAINKSSTVKAVAVDSKRQKSLIATANYYRIPHSWSITLVSKCSPQYDGGGTAALIDGLRGTTYWSNGAWQGYQGQDVVAVVDLGRLQSVSELGAGFLQDVGSWIWMPRQVDFEFSTDGRNFTPAVSIPNEIGDRDYDVVTKDFVKTIPRQETRYVRMTARSPGKIPAWHAGSGGDAWIFVDEILIN
ncbi:MAG: GH92 family glycosyl hydrolase [Acidobacteriota bacterium]